MNLKKLFGSGTRVKVLSYFLLRPSEEYYIRELTRILNEQINSLRRELDNLEKIGILKSRAKNRRKFYFLNPYFSFTAELTSIFRKTQDGFASLTKKAKDQFSLDLLVFSGQFMAVDSSIDLLFVGNELSHEAVESFVEKEFEGAPVRFTVMKTTDFLQKLSVGDTLTLEMLQTDYNLIAVNRLKKETMTYLT